MTTMRVACESTRPTETSIGAGTGKPVGRCPECRAWVPLRQNATLKAHERAEFIPETSQEATR